MVMNAGIAGASIMWLLFTALLLGFAYLVYAAANKEDGPVKIVGLTLAWVLVVLIVLSSLYAIIWGPYAGHGMMGSRMYGKGMNGMEMMGEGMMMDKKMKGDMMTPEMQKERMEHRDKMMDMRKKAK